MKLSEFINGYRKLHGLSQKRLADLCRLSISTIVQLENPDNKKRPSVRTIMRLYGGMGLSETEFFSAIEDDERFRGLLDSQEWDWFTESRLLKAYRRLNPQGKKIAVTQIEALAGIPGLQK